MSAANDNRQQKRRIYDPERLAELEALPPTQKNNELSKKFRQAGNTLFGKKTIDDYLKAIKLYNRSICYAEIGTEDVSIGYANRSAVFFELKLYEVCVRDIEQAQMEPAYPKRLDAKLQRRMDNCKQSMSIESRPEYSTEPLVPHLSFPSHKSIPFIADCLELRKDDQFGRYVITNRDLSVGQIICIESPFCTTIDGRQQCEACHNCGLKNYQQLIPCTNCPHVMFCSVKCRDECYKRFHRYECQIMDFLQAVVPDTYSRSTVRSFLGAITSFSSVQDLLAFVRDAKQADQNVFNVDYTQMASNYGHAYGPVYAMQKGPESPFSNEMIKLLSHIVHVLANRTDLKEQMNLEQIEECKRIIEHHHYTNLINLSAVSRISENDEQPKGPDLPKSIYSFRSLLNHSCCPNVMTTGYGNKVILSVVRPIKTGEQLFDNYGVCHTNHDLSTRKRGLMFTCECVACIQKYPTLDETSIGDIPIVLSPEIIERIFARDRSVAILHLKEVEEYLHEFDEHYPCHQLLYIHDIYAIMFGLAYDPEVTLKLALQIGTQMKLN